MTLVSGVGTYQKEHDLLNYDLVDTKQYNL